MKKYFFNMSEAMAMGFNSVVALAELDEGCKHTTESLSGLMGVNHNHLSKVLQKLVREKIITAQRGPNGGYFLTRKPSKIKLIEIFEALDKYESKNNNSITAQSIHDCCSGEGSLTELVSHITDFTKIYLKKTSVELIIPSNSCGDDFTH